MELDKMTVCARCKICGKEFKFRVYPEDLQRYKNGELVLNAFPYISADMRELLISGTCPECWDNMFSRYDD